MHGLLKFVAINILSYLVLIHFLNPKLYKYTITHGELQDQLIQQQQQQITTLIDFKDQSSSIEHLLKTMDRLEQILKGLVKSIQ